MMRKELALGTVVKVNGEEGVVVYDGFGCCRSGAVMVEFDGGEVRGVNYQELQEMEKVIKPRVNSQKCRDCIYWNGQECLRYTSGRTGILFGDGNGAKRLPLRIYPHCQTEEGAH